MSNQLFAKINHSTKTASIYGPGTFLAKDRIKSLGRARWRGDLKQWEVKLENLSEEFIKSHFPEIDFEPSVDGTVALDQQVSEQALVDVEKNNKMTAAPEGMSVSKLLNEIRFLINNYFSSSRIVYGVLSKVTRSQGRVFLELADDQNDSQQISLVIWEGEEELCRNLKQAGFALEVGLQVMFEVSVQLNSKKAFISFGVLKIFHEYTLAKLSAKRELTNTQLKEEGLFDLNKKIPIPFLPRKLGLLTSSAGTVINDFRASLDTSKFGFELFWYPVSVQGDSAIKEIVRGLKILEKSNVDLILIFRGGGSPADLAVFSEYQLAKAVCLCKKPVFSAIGHEEDQSSVQDVSCRAFGVPKEIGHYLAEMVINYRRLYSERVERIAQLMRLIVDLAERRMKAISELINFAVAKTISERNLGLIRFCKSLRSLMIQNYRSCLQNLSVVSKSVKSGASKDFRAKQRELMLSGRKFAPTLNLFLQKCSNKLKGTVIMVSNANFMLRETETTIAHKQQLFDSASPDTQMKRGFVMVEKENGSYALRATDLGQRENVILKFFDSNKIVQVK